MWSLVVDVVLSLVFLGDFLARLRNAHDKRFYFFQGLGWLDLISCVPFLRLARIVRIGRVLRKLRAEGGLRSTLAALGEARASSSLLAGRVRRHPDVGVRQHGHPGGGVA